MQQSSTAHFHLSLATEAFPVFLYVRLIATALVFFYCFCSPWPWSRLMVDLTQTHFVAFCEEAMKLSASPTSG